MGNVRITPEELARSNEAKKMRRKTSAQLPVFRDSANLMGKVASISLDSPRRLAKYIDCMIGNINESMITIAYANESSGEERARYISNSLSIMYVFRTQFAILQRIGVISKDNLTLLKKEIDGVIAQLIAWRDFSTRQGCHNE